MKRSILPVFTLLSAALAFLSGCATTSDMTLADYEREPAYKFPTTAVFYQRPSDEFLQACRRFDGQSMLHHCQVNEIPLKALQREMQASQVFEAVNYADSEADYQALVTTAIYNQEEGSELANAVVSGGSLGLVPMKNRVIIKADVALSWNGILVKRYAYELPFASNISLFNLTHDVASDMARSVVSHMIRDFQQDQLYSYAALQPAIQSSDYTLELDLPNHAAMFIREDTVQLPDPFQGVQARYSHEQFSFDYVDIFVYPIPTWQWPNQAEVLQREALYVRRELAYIAEQSGVSDLALNDDQVTTIISKGDNTSLLSFEGRFSINGENYVTRTYLAMQEDKFIKARASFVETGSPLADTDQFFSELINNMSVPKESRFMNQVRRSWQERAQQEAEATN